ncbi:MAG: HAMP domain-containing histidine kinase [Acidobacteriota bacterium]|nr:HAMP domain-containing histidine kinase [Acidobacteriota bacterium]MDH3783817.1 HAMP domain-containing histidine kinase [Acidobacteriota bacterium]
MTVRLVALMSVVLLLSLTAFGLSVNYYQDQLMEEVARTAAAVGKATLRTFEFGDNYANQPTVDGDILVWASGHGEPTDTFRSASGARTHTRRIERRELPDGQTAFTDVTCHGPEGPDAEAECVTVERLDGPVMIVAGTGTAEGVVGPDDANHFVIRINDIHTESVDDTEMILTIPRVEGVDPEELRRYASTTLFRSDGAWVDAAADPVHPMPRTAGWTADFVADHARGPDLESLRLPISTEDYRKLFAQMQTRSLFLFLGVFLVGTVLSAGLATRFTRPIRKLDAGLRKISDGDLEVEVSADGSDEMARLGVAFNEMTRRLRDSRERSRDLVRREKLTAVGRLAAGVAHDVRNPLHSIGLTLEHLRESCRPAQDDRGQEFDDSVEIIRGEIRRLDRLVANFLRFTTSDGGERQLVDVAALLRETAQLVRKEAEWRKVDVQVVVDDGPTTLWGDSEALRSSVLNLVLNSFEAMPDGGRLDLTLRSEADRLTIEVRDDGRGIPEEQREKVFEFGYTTREGGNGLGLAMVHQTVVEDHGGQIGLESRAGAGTTVRMMFPTDVQSLAGSAA